MKMGIARFTFWEWLLLPIVVPFVFIGMLFTIMLERGVTKAFGGKRGGSHWQRKRRMADGANLPVFLSANNLSPYIDNDLRVALSSPMLYRTKEGESPVAFGVPATALPEMCEVFVITIQTHC